MKNAKKNIDTETKIVNRFFLGDASSSFPELLEELHVEKMIADYFILVNNQVAVD